MVPGTDDNPVWAVSANRAQNVSVKGRMGLVSSLVRDLKFAVRQMRQAPIVSGVALLSLALGIGANVAIFSLVNALILKPLPVYEPDRLVILGLDSPRAVSTSLTNPVWEYVRDHQEVLVATAAWGNPRFNLASGGASPCTTIAAVRPRPSSLPVREPYQ